jgi:hypothetical protein
MKNKINWTSCRGLFKAIISSSSRRNLKKTCRAVLKLWFESSSTEEPSRVYFVSNPVHLMWEVGSVSETQWFLINSKSGQKSKTWVLNSVSHHCQNASELIHVSFLQFGIILVLIVFIYELCWLCGIRWHDDSEWWSHEDMELIGSEVKILRYLTYEYQAEMLSSSMIIE